VTKLYSLAAWDVELVEDEEWGRVLVAQRDFAPGEVIAQSGMVAHGRSPADFMRAFMTCDVDVLTIIGTDIKFATTSPR
jgi:hypothetical protein